MSRPNKRRKTQSTVQEIAFDPADRQEYLTGFHKRKQQRIKHAQAEAAKKERAFKIQHRKELREQREKEIKAHVENVNAILRKTQEESSEDDSEDGSQVEEKLDQNGTAAVEQQVGQEAEFIDEDKHTTVTVEPMNMSSSEDEDGEQDGENAAPRSHDSKDKASSKKPAARNKPKKKRQKFRYESKGERKITRKKQGVKKSAAARARRDNARG